MGLVLVVLAAALVAGRLRGGRLSRLRLRSPGLLAAALLGQAAGGLLGGAAYAAGLAVSALLVGAFLVRNRGLPGTGLVALGLLGNALVVGLNAAMPVSQRAAARAGAPVDDVVLGLDPRHELETPATRLRPLGDVVPVPLPLLPAVVSPGDVLVAAGLGRLVLVGTGSRGRTGRTERCATLDRTRIPRRSHGEEGPQAAGSQEAPVEPRQAAQRLTADRPQP